MDTNVKTGGREMGGRVGGEGTWELGVKGTKCDKTLDVMWMLTTN